MSNVFDVSLRWEDICESDFSKRLEFCEWLLICNYLKILFFCITCGHLYSAGNAWRTHLEDVGFARSIPSNETIICVTWHSLNGNIFKRCIAFGSMLEKAKRSCTRLLQFFEVTKSFACWVKELRTRCKLLVKTFYLKRSFQADKNLLWWFKDFESFVYI